jgi:hypothetical protein
MRIFTRFSHSLTFSYGSNQEDKEILGEADEVISLERSKKIPRFTKARGKRLVAAVNKFKQFQIKKGVRCTCNPLADREWLGELNEWVTKDDREFYFIQDALRMWESL